MAAGLPSLFAGGGSPALVARRALLADRGGDPGGFELAELADLDLLHVLHLRLSDHAKCAVPSQCALPAWNKNGRNLESCGPVCRQLIGNKCGCRPSRRDSRFSQSLSQAGSAHWIRRGPGADKRQRSKEEGNRMIRLMKAITVAFAAASALVIAMPVAAMA